MPLSTLEAVQVGTELVSYVDALNVHMNYYLTVLVMWPLSMDWNTTRCRWATWTQRAKLCTRSMLEATKNLD